ncbi:leucine-rich repeat domain-containing protein [Flavobacterium sharifuzzamanii]|uniref:leucine-rich repeat domain-containing protein n=1 Tax=Flavobacterium sharifuzzamanii TaxID=2211133 RepID=UPI000DADA766|nr:leucine-rich repeat domain-containing protein [Flavobacterium sharifuzzamanii]KAF2082130.1 leucine-rich repeat protein [Flavobacterium sharifuzzamanii]
MGALLQNTVFGKQKIKPNTFIGGVSSSLSTPALVATKLKIPVSRIKSFSIVENNIQFAVIGGSYILPNLNSGPFNGFGEGITYYDDRDGLVTRVAHSCFRNSDSTPTLLWVNLPNCTIFENYAFGGCTTLQTVNAPLITTIGQFAFASTKITNVSYNYCTSVADSAFAGCMQNTSVNLPVCTTLERNAFLNNSKLNTVTLPNVTTIGASCFENNPNLEYVSMPNLTSIPTGAFRYCPLATFNFPSVTFIGSQSFRDNAAQTIFYFPELLSADVSSFYGTKATDYIFNKLTSCANYAFSNCTNAVNINIPKCTQLGENSSYNNVFDGIKKGCSITVNIFLQNNNTNTPDGDLQFAISSRSALVNFTL